MKNQSKIFLLNFLILTFLSPALNAEETIQITTQPAYELAAVFRLNKPTEENRTIKSKRRASINNPKTWKRSFLFAEELALLPPKARLKYLQAFQNAMAMLPKVKGKKNASYFYDILLPKAIANESNLCMNLATFYQGPNCSFEQDEDDERADLRQICVDAGNPSETNDSSYDLCPPEIFGYGVCVNDNNTSSCLTRSQEATLIEKGYGQGNIKSISEGCYKTAELGANIELSPGSGSKITVNCADHRKAVNKISKNYEDYCRNDPRLRISCERVKSSLQNAIALVLNEVDDDNKESISTGLFHGIAECDFASPPQLLNITVGSNNSQQCSPSKICIARLKGFCGDTYYNSENEIVTCAFSNCPDKASDCAESGNGLSPTARPARTNTSPQRGRDNTPAAI